MADLKSINSVAAASLKSFNGVAAASLKSIAGLSVTPPAWDVSKMTYANKSKDVSAQDTYIYGVAFSSDGTSMYVIGNATDTVYQYTLSTAWDVSTASYASKNKGVSGTVSSPLCITFSSDGAKMYGFSCTNDTVYQ